MKNQRFTAMIISVAISIVTIALVFRYTETNVTFSAISRADYKYVLLAVGLHILFWIFWAARLWYLTTLVSKRISFKTAMKATLASGFIGAVTPASAGGEPMRVKMLNDAGVSCGCGTAVILAERLLDSFFFLLGLIIFLSFTDFARGYGLQVEGAFLVVFLLTLAFLWELLRKPERIEKAIKWLKKKFGSRKILDYVEREIWTFRDSTILLACTPKIQIPITLAITAVTWVVEFAIPSVLLVGLGQKPNFIYSFTSQFIIVLVAGIPITPGSSGVVELSMTYLYSSFVPTYILGILVLIWRFITYFINLAVGAPFAGQSFHKR